MWATTGCSMFLACCNRYNWTTAAATTPAGSFVDFLHHDFTQKPAVQHTMPTGSSTRVHEGMRAHITINTCAHPDPGLPYLAAQLPSFVCRPVPAAARGQLQCFIDPSPAVPLLHQPVGRLLSSLYPTFHPAGLQVLPLPARRLPFLSPCANWRQLRHTTPGLTPCHCPAAVRS
jgi:hypothetical protein